MLKIDRTGRRFERLEGADLRGRSLSERYDLQAMIRANPSAFFAELGEKLLLLGEEVRPAPEAAQVDDRIDLLALDPSGAVVVVELKRGTHKLQLLQALTYAAMIRSWDHDRLLGRRATTFNRPMESVEDDVRQFLDEDAPGVNHAQRIVLIAEGFDFTVLATAEWLREVYGVDVRCYRMTVSVDGDREYLNCTCIYPPAELVDQAAGRRRMAARRASVAPSDDDEGNAESTRALPPADWDEALSTIENLDVISFFRAELAAGRANNLNKRVLRFTLGDKRRWWTSARRQHAYTWQEGRFDDDIAFWTERLGADADIQPVKGASCLSFNLSTASQFDAFRKAVIEELTPIRFENRQVDEVPRESPITEINIREGNDAAPMGNL